MLQNLTVSYTKLVVFTTIYIIKQIIKIIACIRENIKLMKIAMVWNVYIHLQEHLRI